MELTLELEAGHPFMEQAMPGEPTSVQVNQETYDPPAEGTPSELLPHDPDQGHEVAVNDDAPHPAADEGPLSQVPHLSQGQPVVNQRATTGALRQQPGDVQHGPGLRPARLHLTDPLFQQFKEAPCHICSSCCKLLYKDQGSKPIEPEVSVPHALQCTCNTF
jgi:hypothetical protein